MEITGQQLEIFRGLQHLPGHGQTGISAAQDAVVGRASLDGRGSGGAGGSATNAWAAATEAVPTDPRSHMDPGLQ
jgi:hypothetical protein